MRQAISTLADVLTFGKYRGKTVGEVIDLNPGYILWLVDENVIEMPEDMYEGACEEDANQSPPEEFYWQPD